MRAYQDMVFSTASRLASNDRQAEDIAQEVFLRAYEHFDQLRASPTAGGWLKTVATNLTLNYLTRHRKRWRLFSELRPATAEEDSAPEPTVPQPDTLLADLSAEQRRALIEGALRKLPEHQRLALVLYHFEELSYEEIAVKLHASLRQDQNRYTARPRGVAAPSAIQRHRRRRPGELTCPRMTTTTDRRAPAIPWRTP